MPSALDLLHHCENQNVAAPMQTYTSIISSLFAGPSSLARPSLGRLLTYALRQTSKPRHRPLHKYDLRLCQPSLDPLLLRARKGA
jgi:hypothetical protein